MINLLKLFSIFIFFFLDSAVVQAADIKFTPQSPLVEIGKSIVLSVSGTVGQVRWSVFDGQIEGDGNQVTYFAPTQVGKDTVTVKDSVGSATVEVIITAPNVFSLENAVWEVFTNRNTVTALALSEDGKTLWVGTTGGLEEWSTTTGRLQNILLSADDLPNSPISAILNDGQNGLWISTSKHDNHYWTDDKLISLIHRSEQGKLTIHTAEKSNFSSDDINVLISDGNSGLWIGTNDGLAHFSQNQWTIYNSENSDLPSDTVNAILGDGHGGIWIGTSENYDGDTYKYIGGGLAHLSSQGGWTIYNRKNSELPSNNVKVLHRDEQDNLWVVTSSVVGYFFALTRFSHHGLWTIYDTENSGLSSDEVNVFIRDNQGSLWFGTEEGGLIHRNSNGEWIVYTTENSSLPSNKINAILNDNQGGLWIGTSGNDYFNADKYIEGSLAYLNRRGEWTVFSSNSRLPNNSVNALYSDNQGSLWIGSEGGLVHRSNQDKWTVYTRGNSELPSNYIKVLLKDEENGLWIGCKRELLLSDEWEWYKIGGGLAHRNEQNKWVVLTTDNSDLPSNDINALVHDGYGGLWIGTDEGLAHYNGQKQWQIFNKENSELPDDEVTALLTDGKNGIWIGTHNGFAHYDGQEQWQVFNTKNSSLSSNYINVLHDDGQGRIWIGTTDGLAHYSAENEWQTFNQENSGLPNNEISALASDGQGGLWIGTLEFYDDDIDRYVGGSLAHLSLQGEWTAYNRSDKMNSKRNLRDLIVPPPPPPPPSPPIFPTWVNALVEDGQNGLWIGESSRGLAYLTFGRTSSLIKDITDPDIIKTILSDKHAAIIIAGKGSGAEKGDNIWDTTKAVTSYIYRTLYDRGFLNSQIYYLSPEEEIDFNGDNYPDKIVDAPHPGRPLKVTDVEEAFRWVTQRGKLDQPLYFFFMDHGDSNSKLTLSPEESLEATKLKELLDNYQTTTGNEVILVIDACYSGIFLEGLRDSRFKRAIISSTGDGLAYPFERESFSYYLAEKLNATNFFEAYNLAQEKLTKLMSKYNDRYDTEKTQIPRFEDGNQGEWLKQVSINGNFRVENSLLAIKELIPSTILSANQSLPLKVEVNFDSARPLETAERITRVWAIVKPPKMDLVIGVNGTPIITFDYVPLSRSREVKNLWQTRWNKGIYNGDYEISFYAEDDKNNIASSNSIFITVQNGTDPPPQANVQIQVEKNRYQRGEIFNATIIQQLGWSYDLYVAVTLPPEGKEYVLLNNTNKFLPASTILPWVLQGRAENQMISIIKDFELPMDLPTGQYCLWAILSPQDEDVFMAKSQGLWGQFPGQQCFEVF